MTNMRSGLYINTEGFRDRLSSYSFTWCAGLLRHGGWAVRSQLALSHLNWSNTTNYSHCTLTGQLVSTGPRYLPTRQTNQSDSSKLLSQYHPAVSLICPWVGLTPPTILTGQLVSQVSTGPRYLHRQTDTPATFLEGQQTAFTSSPTIRWVKLKTKKSFG